MTLFTAFSPCHIATGCRARRPCRGRMVRRIKDGALDQLDYVHNRNRGSVWTRARTICERGELGGDAREPSGSFIPTQ